MSYHNKKARGQKNFDLKLKLSTDYGKQNSVQTTLPEF